MILKFLEKIGRKRVVLDRGPSHADFKNRDNIKPTGFIHAKQKLFLSLSNGRLLIINSSTGFQEKIIKLHGSKISRPSVFNNNMYLIKDNAIVKIN